MFRTKTYYNSFRSCFFGFCLGLKIMGSAYWFNPCKLNQLSTFCSDTRSEQFIPPFILTQRLATSRNGIINIAYYTFIKFFKWINNRCRYCFDSKWTRTLLDFFVSIFG